MLEVDSRINGKSYLARGRRCDNGKNYVGQIGENSRTAAVAGSAPSGKAECPRGGDLGARLSLAFTAS